MKLPLLSLICLAVLAVAGCGARAETATEPVAITAEPVPLDPTKAARAHIGALSYAGGFQLTSPAKDFGGFSGIDVLADGRFISETDAGRVLTGRIVLDQRGRLAGVADTVMASLTDPQGVAYDRKRDADSEDVTFLPGGGFAIAFEQLHRIETYSQIGAASRRLARPPGADEFQPNRGLEALTVWTDGAHRPRLVQGAEDGRVWSCDMEGAGCELILDPVRDGPEKDFSLTGLDALPEGQGMVAVYRAFDLIHGNRAMVAWIRPDAPRKVTVLARLSAPYTVDNMEGIAALPNPDGSIRLYLVSDDNFNPIQRTLLLAFDWRGPPRRR